MLGKSVQTLSIIARRLIVLNTLDTSICRIPEVAVTRVQRIAKAMWVTASFTPTPNCVGEAPLASWGGLL